MNLLNSFSFELPTKIEYGVGAAKSLVDVIKNENFKNLLLVSDEGVLRSGLLKQVSDALDAHHLKWEVFDRVEPNPKDYNVEEGTEIARRFGADCLVAVGGGSPIDCAKAIAVVARQGGAVRDYEGPGKIGPYVLPLIAIPTTAGTGSEVTFSSVITDSSEKFKFSIKDPKIAPRLALVDPEMTRTMPPALTAATGMDALTHAIEAFTAKAAEPLADAAALYAIELIAVYLKSAVADGDNLEARAGMLLGSVLAGIAFSHSDVAAVHCVAEALGGKYDAAHGVCNAVVLPAVMEYNMEYCKEQYARIAVAMGMTYENIDEGARQAVMAVQQLAADVHLPEFGALGVQQNDLEELAVNSFKNGSNIDNPRPMTKDDYLSLFQSLIG
ncbi:MAG: iron-containing alcohol dehydrogenase [Desulfobacterales bacterium]|jgi:alcohol dehydrogenase